MRSKGTALKCANQLTYVIALGTMNGIDLREMERDWQAGIVSKSR